MFPLVSVRRRGWRWNDQRDTATNSAGQSNEHNLVPWPVASHLKLHFDLMAFFSPAAAVHLLWALSVCLLDARGGGGDSNIQKWPAHRPEDTVNAQ